MISVFGTKTNEVELKYLKEVIDTSFLGLGKVVNEFENRFQERLNLPNFIMLDNCSNSLYVACKVLDLPKNSEIIVPSFTWLSCAHSIIMAGHKPIFCDVELDTMNVSRETIEPLITKKTGAIMIVHYAGLSVEMDGIMDLGLPVIEDSAHSVDSKYGDVYSGGVGTIGVYSFDGAKNLAVGEGGGLTSTDEEIFERVKNLRYCGITQSGFDSAKKGNSRWWEYDINDIHMKNVPSNVDAAVGLAQLDKLDYHQSIRKKIWDYYTDEFKNTKLTLPIISQHQHSYFTYCIRVNDRDNFAKYLFKNDIYSTVRYHPLHMNSIYNSMDISLPNTEQLNEDSLCIPLHPGLKDSEVEYVVEKVKGWLDE
jgi:aminotransferase